MSVSKTVLRRAIGLRTRQPFFERYGTMNLDATGGTTTTLIDTVNLKQINDFWNGQHLYLPVAGKSRVISDFAAATQTATFLEPLASAVLAGDDYEIWSQFSANDVHAAINAALRDAWPFFFTQNEGYLVIQDEVGVSYALSSLSPAPRWIAKVQMEEGVSSITGQATSTGTNLQVIDSNAQFTSADVGKEIRVYAGTSKGDRRTVASVADAHTLAVSVAFTAALTTTSKYRLADVNNALLGYKDVWQWGLDKRVNPSYLRFSSTVSWTGYLLRLVYESELAELSAETDTTTCPQEYLELATVARLYLIKIASAPRSELDNWIAMQRAHTDAAQSFAQKNAFAHYAGAIATDQAYGLVDPEYPFR